MNELLYGNQSAVELDFLGSLVDADLGAYYNWLNQQRLTGADRSSFVVWYEGHNEAVAIGPSLQGGTIQFGRRFARIVGLGGADAIEVFSRT